MGGHKSKSCTFSEPAVLTPPPVPDLIVSNWSMPDCSGNYFKDGTYNGHDKYKRADGSFYIYYLPDYGLWFMSWILGWDEDAWVNPEQDTLLGQYSLTGNAAGYPIVSIP